MTAPGIEPAGSSTTIGRLLRSSVTVGVGTTLSRVTGLIRTLVLAWALGLTELADAYNLANTTPNVVYDLLLGGVLAATLVPVLVVQVQHDDDDAVSAVLSVLTTLLVAVTVVAIVAAPLILRAYTWDLDAAARAAQETVAIPLLRLLLLQIVFYGFTTLGSALLNAHRRFALAAFAPVINNVIVIGVLIAVPWAAGGFPTLEQVAGDTGLLLLLGLGTTAGIVAMALVLVPGIVRLPRRLRWNLDWRNPAVTKILRLSGWTFGYVLSNQIGFVVLLALAIGTEPGAVSAWSYAYLFFQLPYGLFAVSIMTTFLPELADAHSAGDEPRFASRFNDGLRLMLLVVLPSAIVLAALALPTIAVLFERGSFDGASTIVTANALATFAFGLPGFAAYLFAMRGFYARTDTRSPFVINAAETAFTLAIAVPLTARFGLTGTVSAFGIGYTVFAVVALVALRRRLATERGTTPATPGGPPTWRGFVPIAGAGVAMAVVVVGVTSALDTEGTLMQLVEILVASGTGALVYLGVLAALGSHDFAAVRRRLAR